MFSNMKVCCVFSLESSKSAAMGFFFQETQERVQNSRGKRAIGIRAAENLLYTFHVAFMNVYFVLKHFID